MYKRQIYRFDPSHGLFEEAAGHGKVFFEVSYLQQLRHAHFSLPRKSTAPDAFHLLSEAAFPAGTFPRHRDTGDERGIRPACL